MKFVQWRDPKINRYVKIDNETNRIHEIHTSDDTPFEGITIVEKQPGKVGRKRVNYVSNKDMLNEIKLSHEQGQPTTRLCQMFHLIALGLSQRPNFSGYSYLDEMIANGLEVCVRRWKSFNPEKSDNPFSYFTTCINNAFIVIIKREKKHQRLRDEILIANGMNASNDYHLRHEIDNHTIWENEH